GNQYYDRFQILQYQFLIGPTNGWIDQFWYEYYQFIYTTNSMVSVCGDNEVVKEQRGIAKTFRALYYMDMARLYDPLYAVSTERPDYQARLASLEGLTVPIVDENTTEEDAKNNPRAPREVIFQFIFDDLNDAEACLAEYAPTAKNLPSLAVVYGLKARAYLWLGGFEEGKYDTEKYPDVLTGNAAYKKAAEYARKAITASGCTPLTEAEYCDPYTGFAKAANSWMWAMIQSTDTIIATLYSWASHMCCEASWGYGGMAKPGVRKATYERMSNTDFRKKLIVGPNTTYADYKDVTVLTEEEWQSWGQEKLPMTTYAHLKFRTNNGEKVNSGTGNVVDIPLMRVEEMYLIEAEATAHYDEATGKQLVTSFMTSYRDPEYKVPVGVAGEALIEEIIFQKRCELWGEGLLLYDFKRLDMGLDNAYDGSNAPVGMDFQTEGRCPAWNFCIPVSEVEQNKALEGKNNPDPSYTLKAKSEM
uniref:RagB/SusD family nutrient uptake outer membrane protein n=1 Tax=Alistipes sp. TaxID=1872444 RepID=UPI00405726C9